MTRICFILLSVLALAFANGEAWAQAWPTRPIRAIVAFPPEASSTLWRVWSAISSRASSVSRWSLKIAAVRNNDRHCVCRQVRS